MDNDGYISNGELFQVLKMMVGNNLKDTQLQQIVDKTILMNDKVIILWVSQKSGLGFCSISKKTRRVVLQTKTAFLLKTDIYTKYNIKPFLCDFRGLR